MNVFRSIAVTTITIADTVTIGMVALNHLMRGASERAVIVEQKSIAAAALSQLNSQFDVANRLTEIHEANVNITPEILTEADTFLANYMANRSNKPVIRIVNSAIHPSAKAKAKAKAKAHKKEHVE